MLTSGRIIATISGTWTHVAGTEDETVGWHYQLDGHEFEQALGVGDGQGSLACCSPWGQKELDMTEQLNWTDFGEGVDISRIWATTHFLFLTIPGNCHGTSGCVIHLLIKDQGLLSHLGPILGLFCVLGLCHSFKSCALPLSLLLQEYWIG